MYCPACEKFVFIDDLEETTPFECPKCHTLIELVIEESRYQGGIYKITPVRDKRSKKR